MLSDFLPIRKNLAIDDYRDGITIVPLSDAHYGSEDFNSVKWHDAIKRIQDDPTCYAVLVGDLIDNGLKNSLTNVYHQTATPREQKKWLANELMPIKDKILAAVGGNHERRTVREVDQDPMYDVLAILGIEHTYRQNIAFLSISFTYTFRDQEKPRTSYQFAITHGAGGGMYIGSSANRAQTFGVNIEGIDCLVVGHTHKPVTFPVSKLVFDTHSRFVEQRQFTVVVASSFLDYGGYPVEKLLTPTAHVLTEIKIFPEMKGKKILRVIQ